jgi:uncharacterized LabA/DUF88 family protein
MTRNRTTPTESTSRVVVFVDYMNVFNDARAAFCAWPFGPADGQIEPMKLGRLLASKQPLGTTGGRVCKEVRVYRGRPDPRKEPKTHAAHMRQCAAWAAAGATVIPRPLRYPRDWPKTKEEEKGIDVQLAIDAVMMAINGELDVAILATTDTDQRPVLEAFHQLPMRSAPAIEVSTWKSPTFSKKLQVKGLHVWSHYIEEPEYRAIRDRNDYNVA